MSATRPASVVDPGGYPEMLKLITNAQSLWATRDRGATAVEYGLLVALIAGVIIAVVVLLGGEVMEAFDKSCDAIANSNKSGDECK